MLMFRAFNLINISDKSFGQDRNNTLYRHYQELGNDYFCKQKGKENLKKVTNFVSDYMHDKHLNADLMQQDWFPKINADIFLSHSHADENLAVALAGFLYKNFGLHTFLDSKLWSYMDEKSKDIINYACSPTCDYGFSSSFDRDCKNVREVTAHMNMMLLMSLANMIDNCECLFFLNTPKSLSGCTKKGSESTLSPWIYVELSLSRIIRRREPNRLKSLDESISIAHHVSLDELHDLKFSDLIAWKKEYRKNSATSPLDLLYELVKEKV